MLEPLWNRGRDRLRPIFYWCVRFLFQSAVIPPEIVQPVFGVDVKPMFLKKHDTDGHNEAK